MSHDIWEGRRAVEAARQAQRVVAADLPSRSAGYVESAKKTSPRASWAKSISAALLPKPGRATSPIWPTRPPPAGLDWNSWNGPAPETAYNANLQDNWHGYWRYSGGNAAVEGIHQLDLARWLCGRRLPQDGHLARRAVRHGRGQRNARYAGCNLRVRGPLDDLRADAGHAVYGAYFARRAQWRRDSLLAAVRRARGDLRQRRPYMCIGPHGTGWQVFGRPRHEQPTLLDRSGASRWTWTTRRTSSPASARAKPPAWTPPKPTAARGWCIMPT